MKDFKFIKKDLERPLPGKNLLRNTIIIVVIVSMLFIALFVAYEERQTGDRLRNEFSSIRTENELLRQNLAVKDNELSEINAYMNVIRNRLYEQEIIGRRLLLSYDFTELSGVTPDMQVIDDDSDDDGLADDIDPHPDGSSSKIPRKIIWSYNGKPHELTFVMDSDWYDYYKQRARQTSKEQYITPGHPLIVDISTQLRDMALENNYQSYTEFVLSFVQHIPFVEDVDSVGYGYPRFPIETLGDFKGDCEDMTYLASSILLNLNIDTVLIDIPGHIVPGVACANCAGASFEYAGRRYFYIEPTASGWTLGEIPDEYEQYVGQNVLIRGLGWA